MSTREILEWIDEAPHGVGLSADWKQDLYERLLILKSAGIVNVTRTSHETFSTLTDDGRDLLYGRTT